ncbi:MAG: DUF4159 domain-containing protein [Elusimicrobiota bacterium]|jgi:hypothetical protein
MTFTHPSLLWALPLALVPPLLHLLSLRRARREPFSDLTLLRAVEAKAAPKRRLRSWLLALVRSSLVAALALAWAGPVVSRDPVAGGGDSGSGSSLAVLLDASYSMGWRVHGRTRFEAARAAGESIVRGLGPTDRVAAAVFSDQWESPSGGLRWADGKGEALETLAKASLTSRGTDVCSALSGAVDLLAKEDVRRRARRAVIVLSDGAAHGLACRLPAIDPAVAVLGLSWDGVPSNAWVASAGPAAESSAKAASLSVRGRTSGPAGRATQARLFLAGARSGAVGLDLGPGREGRAVLRLGPALPGDPRRPSWAGWVELTPDSLSSDDRWYFSFRHGRRPKALVLHGSQDFFRVGRGGWFLKELLGAEKGSLLGWDADFRELSRFNEAPLSEYRVVVLGDLREVPAEARAGLEDFARSGGGLWVLPGSSTPDAAFDDLGRILPAEVGPAVVSPEPFGLSAPGAAGFEEFELARVAVRRYRRLSPRPGARVLFRLASGAPALVAGPLGRGSVVLWASPLDLDSTNLGLKPAFAAWAAASLDAASRTGEEGTEVLQLRVGEPIALSWKEGEPLPASVKVRSPDGRLSQLYPKDRRALYDGTSVPGLYSVVEEGRAARQTFFGVNLDRARESDLTPAAAPPWSPLRLESLEEDLRNALFGRDARPWLLAVAGLLLALEMLLAFPRLLGTRPSPARASFRTLSGLSALLVLSCGSEAWAAPEVVSSTGSAAYGDRFVWSQLKLGPDWDPYPQAHAEVLELFGRVTSVIVWPERRVLSPEDELLFESPLLILAGAGAPPALTERQLRSLRSFVSGGGMLWLEDVSGAGSSPFDRWVRAAFLPSLLPEAELASLPSDHVLYKTFFFLRAPAGRASVRPSLEGVVWGGRVAVLYSRNDILGAWAKDGLGRHLFSCAPGGEAQRHNTRKLTLNILMYSLTGSYKADAVHQPYLLEKMRLGVP